MKQVGFKFSCVWKTKEIEQNRKMLLRRDLSKIDRAGIGIP